MKIGRTKRAFTLAEILIVIVIIGILASIALPNYYKTIERSHLRDAENNLMAIHAANRIFFTETGDYWPNGGPFYLTDINNNLRLSIVANGFTYFCLGSAPLNFYVCVADRDPAATPRYRVTVTQVPINPGVNPICSAMSEPCP